jgi:hypothetical protein
VVFAVVAIKEPSCYGGSTEKVEEVDKQQDFAMVKTVHGVVHGKTIELERGRHRHAARSGLFLNRGLSHVDVDAVTAETDTAWKAKLADLEA